MATRYLLYSISLFVAIPASLWGAGNLPVACGWLERMNEAITTLNYEGHFVYQHDDLLEAMRIRHQLVDQGTREHLQSLNGYAREVIRDNNSITIIENSAGSVRVKQRNSQGNLSPLPTVAVEELVDYYDLLMGETARVAGRPGQVIILKPLDEYRYGYRLILDKETALPLDVTVMDNNSQTISRIMYTNLTVSAPPMQMAEEKAGLAAMDTPKNPSRSSTEGSASRVDIAIPEMESATGWRFNRIPSGFRLKNYQAKRLDGEQSKLEHFVYSDGVASISVYIEPYDASRAISGNTRLSAINVIGRQQNDHQLTVVGEVPVIALQMVIDGIEQARH